MLARATTFALMGVDALEVTVEADIHQGLPAFSIVGLPDAAVREARERVRAALVNTGFEFPLRRITVNLAPGDFRKAGSAFDLAVAAAVLTASGQTPPERLDGYAVCGELGLDGSVRPVRGALVIADAARRAGRQGLLLPAANAPEASLVQGLEVVGVRTVGDLSRFLAGHWRPPPADVDAEALLSGPPAAGLDLRQVRGHIASKRALEIAAAGAHHVLMVGVPGSGKSMLARRLPSILPPLDLDEALEATRVHSVAGLLRGPLVAVRPFRAPHHSISGAGLIGGGSTPQPGEASLAHNGVLFLDELGEFGRAPLEALRQPLECGSVSLTRSQRTVSFPTRFTLVAATNPCPCGHFGDRRRQCACHPTAHQRYRSRLSGPLLDRIDIVLRIEPPSRDELMSDGTGEGSSEVRARVAAACERRLGRLAADGIGREDEVEPERLRKLYPIAADARAALADSHDRLGLSARGHDRALRVARTIADLAGRNRVEREDVVEAVAYRELGPADLFGAGVAA